MANNPCNEAIIEQLRNGLAHFELVTTPAPSISSQSFQIPFSSFFTDTTHRFFARIGPSLSNRSFVFFSVHLCGRHRGGVSPALKKLERYSVQKVTGDGRCLFRALVKGMALNKGVPLNPREERENADELRTAVKEVICDSDKDRLQFEEALVAITVDESLKRYCQRIGRADFWGGESELLVLSKLCRQPVIVYIPAHEHTGGTGSGFIPIAEYGGEYGKGSRKFKAKKAVRLLFSGKNHYDLLL